jgi:putative PIN family toxin of toxin-antitoxin system
VRAVLDPNVLISALISSRGAPAQLIVRWLDGHFELVVSPALLDELARALAYPKLAARISRPEAEAFVALLRDGAEVVRDPADTAKRSSDPDDDYLIALAEADRAVLVSGDRDLLALAGDLPVLTARAFLDLLET